MGRRVLWAGRYVFAYTNIRSLAEEKHKKRKHCACPEGPSAGGWGGIAQVGVTAVICEGEV